MEDWPELPYYHWKKTYETLHRLTQIIGKVRLSKSSWANHSWNSTLYVTSRGLSTSAIPLPNRNISLEFDFIDHKLTFEDSRGQYDEIWLKNKSVASFYKEVGHILTAFNIEMEFDPKPNECEDCVPFYQDEIHHTYELEYVERFFQILVNINNIFQKFRSDFIGKSSPVHFFWGSFDLAVTRFSGRKAPEHPGVAPHISPEIIKEAYSHELCSFGFWPGSESYPQAAFYSYAYPEPAKYSKSSISPTSAFYHQGLKEFILNYSDVRASSDPEDLIYQFLNSTYSSCADLGLWDRDALEESVYLDHLQMKHDNLLHLS
ncbi:MAG: DUF5996 family protein [Bacteriovoracaceae bacterium]